MYPVLFSIGEFEVTSFGVMLGVAALVALGLFRHELNRSGLPTSALDAGLAGLLGGMVGAKLIWAVEFRHEGPFLGLLLSRGGLSWFGGFVGGVGAGLWMIRRRRLPMLSVLAAASPALAVGHAIGRVGCFLVGDDYGRPSGLPWAVAFPNGRPPTDVPVHPTQIYETVALLVLAAILVAFRRGRRPDRFSFGVYLLVAGAVRFAIEFVRVNRAVIGPFTLAQLFSAAAIAVGVALLSIEHQSVSEGAATRAKRNGSRLT